MVGKVKEIAGQRFGRVVVLARVGFGPGKACWNCRCDCGVEFVTRGIDLRSGNTTSCGCYKRELIGARSTTHGATKDYSLSGAYRSWLTMKSRCLNRGNNRFSSYGARSITVCDRWLVFENFLADMGERPEGRSLDRINNDGDYEIGNCRWATRQEQAANQRQTKRVVLNGEVLHQAEAARRAGVSPSTIIAWLRKPYRVPPDIHLQTMTA